jgi:lambda repressor-like predicted transcriptional regulator
MDQLDRDASERVKSAMKAAGIGVNQLAANSGIARVTLMRRLSRGGDFTLRELDLIADALGVPTATLYPTRTYAGSNA